MEFAIYLLGLFFIFVFANDVHDENRTVETNGLMETKYGVAHGVRKAPMLKEIEFYSFREAFMDKRPIGELRLKVSLVLKFLCALHIMPF